MIPIAAMLAGTAVASLLRGAEAPARLPGPVRLPVRSRDVLAVSVVELPAPLRAEVIRGLNYAIECARLGYEVTRRQVHPPPRTMPERARPWLIDSGVARWLRINAILPSRLRLTETWGAIASLHKTRLYDRDLAEVGHATWLTR